MLENSKGFDGKLVGMQVICRTNIQTVPRDIYGIYSGDILYHVVILFWRVRPRNLFVFLPGQTGHGWGSEKYDYTTTVSFGVSGAFLFSWFLGGSGYIWQYPDSC